MLLKSNENLPESSDFGRFYLPPKKAASQVNMCKLTVLVAELVCTILEICNVTSPALTLVRSRD